MYDIVNNTILKAQNMTPEYSASSCRHNVEREKKKKKKKKKKEEKKKQHRSKDIRFTWCQKCHLL